MLAGVFGTPGWRLISKVTASASATVDLTGIPAGFETVMVDMSALVPQTVNTNLTILASTDGGGTWLGGTNYGYLTAYWDNAGAGTTGFASVNTGASAWVAFTSTGNASNASVTGQIMFNNVNSTTVHKHARSWISNQANGPTWQMQQSACQIKTASAINAIRLQMGSGNITSGVARIYGLSPN